MKLRNNGMILREEEGFLHLLKEHSMEMTNLIQFDQNQNIYDITG